VSLETSLLQTQQPQLSQPFLRGEVLQPRPGVAWLGARCPPKPLCHPPSSTGQGRKKKIYDGRVVGRDKDRERSSESFTCPQRTAHSRHPQSLFGEREPRGAIQLARCDHPQPVTRCEGNGDSKGQICASLRGGLVGGQRGLSQPKSLGEPTTGVAGSILARQACAEPSKRGMKWPPSRSLEMQRN